MRILIALILACSIPAQVRIPGPGGAAAGGGGGGTPELIGTPAETRANSTTVNLAMTTVSGLNTILVCGLDLYGATATSVAFNSVSLTQLSTVASLTTDNIYLYYLVNPPVTTANVVLTASGGTANSIGCAQFQHVNQSSPFGTPATAASVSQGTTATVNVSAASGDLVIDTLGVYNVTATVGASQSVLWSQVSSGSDLSSYGSTEAGAASVTMSWTLSGSQHWGIIGVALKP